MTQMTKSIKLLLASLVVVVAGLGLAFAAAPASGQVENGAVNWNGWTLDYGVEDGFDGLRLRNVRYEGNLMAHQISLPTMNVYYQDNVCGPYADRLGGTIQGLFTNEFTQDGERWLEIAIEDHIGAYVIYQSYYLSESGVLDAHMFSKGLQCNIYHEHLPFWRFDFDIDGSTNDQILRRAGNGSLVAETSEFNKTAASAADHEWYVRDTVTGRSVRLNFDDGTYNLPGTIVPETAYVENNVYGRQYKQDEELWSGGPTRDLGFNEGEAMSDIVLWYTGYMPHSAAEGPDLWHSTGVRMEFVDDPTQPPVTTTTTAPTTSTTTTTTQPPSECSSDLSVEAETGSLSGAMAIASSGSASGGQYVHVADGTGNAWSLGSNNQAEYCFNISQGGRYRIETQVQGIDSLSDSFFVTVDGQPSDGYLWDSGVSTDFRRDNVSDRGGANPVIVDLSTGEHTVTFHQREDGTRLDSVTLVRIGDSGGGGGGECSSDLSVEAETGSFSGVMSAANDGAASGGQYVHVPDGTGNAWSIGSNNQAEYCFNIAQAGTYRIQTQVRGVDSLSDSFFVTVDGQPSDGYLWDTGVSTNYRTDNVSDRGAADPVTVDLAAGERKITFHHREDGSRLDSITLVRVG